MIKYQIDGVKALLWNFHLCITSSLYTRFFGGCHIEEATFTSLERK